MKSLLCPSCNAPLAIPKKGSINKCSYCDTELRIDWSNAQEFKGFEEKQYQKLIRRASQSLTRGNLEKAKGQYQNLESLLEDENSQRHLDILSIIFSIEIKFFFLACTEPDEYENSFAELILSDYDFINNSYHYFEYIIDFIDKVEDKLDTLNEKDAEYLAINTLTLILNDFSKFKNELLIKLYSNKKEFIFISERKAYINIVIHMLLTRYITICRRGNESVWQKLYLEIYINCEKFKDFAEGEKRDLFQAFQIFNDFKKEYEDYKKIFPSIINTQKQIRKENELKAAKEAEAAKEKIRKKIEREKEDIQKQDRIFNTLLLFTFLLAALIIGINTIYQNRQKGNSYQRSLNRFNSSFPENIYAYTTKSKA